MGMAVRKAAKTLPVGWNPNSQLANTSMISDVMVVVSRLVSVLPTRMCKRETGVSQFDSSTPASMSAFKA